MNMRDLQQLEELSSTAALGLWADDVVVALSRVLESGGNEADVALLKDAADILETAQHLTQEPLATPGSARSLAATETALRAVARLAIDVPETDEQELLTSIADVVRSAADGRLGTSDAGRIEPVIALFGLVGEVQLVESNSVLGSRKDAVTWTGTRTTSTFS